MKILTVLTYYRPHTSGLTIYAERLAEAFAKRGHEVTVLTSHFDKNSPQEEVKNGVRIVRAPVALRISKGVIMPTFGWLAWKYVMENDIVHLHLPQFDAPGFATRARILGKKTILTYHCDLLLPKGLFNKVVNTVVHWQNSSAARLSNHIVTYTQDYADHSAFLSNYKHKLTPILPPVILPSVDQAGMDQFYAKHGLSKTEPGPFIGMATRFASEKGVEILLDALPKILEKFPTAKVLFAGQHLNVMGEQSYFERLIPIINKFEASGHWQFLGNLSPAEMASYYKKINLLVVPSLNSTEAFGLVQIEAMMNNVPCIASSLPGVRRPIQMTGMGLVTPIGDTQALSDAVIEVFSNPTKYQGNVNEIVSTYEPDSIAKKYEELISTL